MYSAMEKAGVAYDKKKITYFFCISEAKRVWDRGIPVLPIFPVNRNKKRRGIGAYES